MPVCRSCQDDKPAEEFPLRDAKRGVRQRRCRACTRAYGREWYKKNCDQHRERVYRWKRENPEKVQRYKKSPRAREWERLWRQKNPHIRRANKARYRAMKLVKTPPLTQEEKMRIREFYRRARELTKKTGVEHVVDHVIPLSHTLGFHHPNNLQVIPAKMNLKKSNKLTLDRLVCWSVNIANVDQAQLASTAGALQLPRAEWLG